jgi:N-acetyl-anhydromuramoyl-L-alanine amidase
VTGRAAFRLDANGWLNGGGVLHVKSPNADARPAGTVIDLLVIHNISLPPGQFLTGAVAQLFTNQLASGGHPYFRQIEGLKVSAHFLIDRFGRITQFVSTQDRAWHAGVSALEAGGGRRERCNDFSIGIELEGCDDLPYSGLQYRALADLTNEICCSYPVTYLRGHNEIAPGRKTDPGPAFDWAAYLQMTGLPETVRD